MSVALKEQAAGRSKDRARLPIMAAAGATLMAAAPAQAQQAAAEAETDLALPEIIVTSEKQGRSIHDTATSVSVFNEEMLENTPGIAALSDLVTRLPNTNSFGKSGLVPTVRGVDGTGPAIGANAFFAGTRNRLNVQVDGRALSYNEVAYGDGQLWDVGQVEALRGPQSTLQGRNAVGGTIAITTKDPTYDFEGAARAVGGNQDLRQGSLALSGPVVDRQVAVRFSADHREYDSYAEMMPTVFGLEDPEHYTATTLRGKLLVEPDAWDDFRALLTITSTSFEAPQVERVRRPFDDHVSALGTGEPVHKTDSLSGIVNTSWALNDHLTFETVLSYTDFEFQRFAAIAPAAINGREFVWEPRLTFVGMDGRLTGIFGAYYFDASQSETIDFGLPSAYEDATETKAIFAELNYAMTDRLTVTVGARGEEEDRQRYNPGIALFVIDLDQTSEVFLPKFGVAYDLTEVTTIGFIASRGYNGGGAGFTFEPPFVNFAFDPEFVWNYEFYTRSSIDSDLSITANVFYSDYSGMQIPFDLNPDPLVNSQIILNADEVITYGAEFGMRWLATDYLEFHGEVGVLNTNIDSPGTLIHDNELTRSADLTGSIGGSYRGPQGIELSVDAQYSGSYYSDEINDPRGYIDAYWVANAQVAYSFERVRLYANVTNLFDNGDPVAIFYGDIAALDNGFLLQPRRLMAGVQVSF